MWDRPHDSREHTSKPIVAAIRCAALIVVSTTTPMATGAVLTGPIVNPANGHSYYLLDQDTWTNSEAQAVTLGGHLATINNAAENQWLQETFGSFGGTDRNLWIGLNDVAAEGTFVWSSGEPVTYTNWDPGQPDNNQAGEDFVHLWSPSIQGGFFQPDKWNDLFDATSFAFAQPSPVPLNGVVEVVPEPGTMALLAMGGLLLTRRRRERRTIRRASVLAIAAGATMAAGSVHATVLTGPIVNPANGHRYYLLDQDTWTNSEAQAVTLGGHLATINDAVENQWVYDTFVDSGRNLWIGLTDTLDEGLFVWSSGEAVTYTNWNPGAPDGGTQQNFAYMIADDGLFTGAIAERWDDAFADSTAFGVVEVVPEPAAAGIVGLGFYLLTWRRHRVPLLA
jgi:hypothetical protein